MLACTLSHFSAFILLLICLIGLISWRWNGEMHSGDDRGPQDGEMRTERRYWS
jgi:hypothetical protein